MDPDRKVLHRFVVLEGVDGSGTTTQLRALDEALGKAGVPHWATCEPTDRPEGALIRRILSGTLGAAPGTVAHLFAADRHEHLYGSGGIIERLDRGETVICDRYILSSLAYQGVTCGLDLPLRLNAEFPLPELLLYFDLSPELSMARVGRREGKEIYENHPFQRRVSEAYEEALVRFRDQRMRMLRIDAASPVDEVTRSLFEALSSVLGFELRM